MINTTDAVIGLVILAGVWVSVLDAHRLKRYTGRNADRRCARCGQALDGAPGPSPTIDDRYARHGRPLRVEVCRPCHRRHRRGRIRKWLSAVAAIVGVPVLLIVLLNHG